VVVDECILATQHALFNGPVRGALGYSAVLPPFGKPLFAVEGTAVGDALLGTLVQESPIVVSTVKIALYLRKCDILLYMYDYFKTWLAVQSEDRGDLGTRKHWTTDVDLLDGLRINSKVRRQIRRDLAHSRVRDMVEAARRHCGPERDAHDLHSTAGSVYCFDSVPSLSGMVPSVREGSTSLLGQDSNTLSPGRGEVGGAPNAGFASSFADVGFASFAAGSEEMHAYLLQTMGLMLAHCLQVLDAGIALLTELYKRDIVEPYSLSRLLEYKARVLEVQLRGREAFDVMQQAETVSIRALGSAAGNTVRLMVEVMRLHVKFVGARTGDPEEAAFVARKANEINQNVVQLSFAHLAMADQFTKRCAELLALSTLDRAGSLLASDQQRKEHLLVIKKEKEKEMKRHRRRMDRM
jgi:hypothetical protein